MNIIICFKSIIFIASLSLENRNRWIERDRGRGGKRGRKRKRERTREKEKLPNRLMANAVSHFLHSMEGCVRLIFLVRDFGNESAHQGEYVKRSRRIDLFRHRTAPNAIIMCHRRDRIFNKTKTIHARLLAVCDPTWTWWHYICDANTNKRATINFPVNDFYYWLMISSHKKIHFAPFHSILISHEGG